MSGKHLNQIDLAKRWNLSHRTLERWRCTGEGPQFLKHGGRVVYRNEDVEAFEASRLRLACDIAVSSPVQSTRMTATPPKAERGMISRRPA